MNRFALELARGIEELCLTKGLDREVLVKQAVVMLDRQKEDIDVLQSIRETEKMLKIAQNKFDNAIDVADIEEAVLEITAAETRLAALRRLAKQKGVKSNEIEFAGVAERR